MARFLESAAAQLGSPDSAVGFATEGGGNWEVWDRYLTLDGKKAYHIGNICNTCAFFFERLEGADHSVAAAEVADELASGITSLSGRVVEAWGRALPKGEYITCLFEAYPTLVAPGSDADYFSDEQVRRWQGVQHNPQTEYYRLGSVPVWDGVRVFQFLIPMFPRNRLKAEDVARHRAALERGNRPTAVAISVLDIKAPVIWLGDPALKAHWCLAHYLLDGHHKTFAAAQSGRPMNLLSFLALNEGLSNEEEVREALQALRSAGA